MKMVQQWQMQRLQSSPAGKSQGNPNAQVSSAASYKNIILGLYVLIIRIPTKEWSNTTSTCIRVLHPCSRHTHIHIQTHTHIETHRHKATRICIQAHTCTNQFTGLCFRDAVYPIPPEGFLLLRRQAPLSQ